jgi:hypothetical protein
LEIFARSPIFLMSSPASLSVSREAVPLPIAMSSTPCLRHSAPLGERLIPLPARFVRIHGRCREQFSGRVDDGHFHAGADAGIEAHHRLRTCRRGEHEVLEVVAEHADRFFFGCFAGAREQVERQRQMQLHAPGEPCGVEQPRVGGATARGNAGSRGDARFGFGVTLFGFGGRREFEREHALVARA